MYLKKSVVIIIFFVFLFGTILLTLVNAHVCNDVVSGPQIGCPDPQTVWYISSSANGNRYNIVSNITALHIDWVGNTACNCVVGASGCYNNADYGNKCNSGSCWHSGFTMQHFDHNVVQGNASKLSFSSNPATPFSLSDKQSQLFDYYIDVDPSAASQHFRINISLSGSLSGTERPIYSLEFDWTGPGPPGCTSNNNCSSPTPYCNTGSGECVACLNAAHCNDSNPCTTDTCSSFTCSHTNLADASDCTGGKCCAGTCDTTTENSNFHQDCRSGPSCQGNSWAYSTANQGGACGSEGTCSSGLCVIAGCTNDSGCASVGKFCQSNTPYNCTLGGDGCLDRVNQSACDNGETCSSGLCIANVPLNGYLNISAESASYYNGDEIKLTGITLPSLPTISFWGRVKDFFKSLFGITGNAALSAFGGSKIRPSLINNTGQNPIVGYLLIKTLKSATLQDYSIVVNETSPRTINAKSSFALKDAWPAYKIDEAGAYILCSEFRDATGKVIKTSEAYLNDSFEFEVRQRSNGGDGGNGGGGGGGGGGTTTTGSTYAVTEKQLEEGYTKELSIGDRFKFDIEKQTNYITVEDTTSTSVKINLTFENKKVYLIKDKDEQFDVDADGWYDINLKLNNLENKKANMTIKKIHTKVIAIDEGANESATIDVPTNITSEKKPSDRQKLWIWILTIVVIATAIVAAIIIFIYIKNKKMGASASSTSVNLQKTMDEAKTQI